MGALTTQTLERLASIQFGKAGISTATGLNFYDLEQEAKLRYFVLTPIRKRMPRIGLRKNEGYGLAAHWNTIDNPNPTNVFPTISEGRRGGIISPTVVPKIATYKGIGIENAVTWEAEYGSEGYDDARALAQRLTLDSLLLAEEPLLLWGNSGNSGTGLAFGTTPTPTGTPSTTGGTIGSGTTTYLYCVALSYAGYINALNQSPNAVVPLVAQLGAEGLVTQIPGGVAILSAASTAQTTTGSTSSIAAIVTAVQGASGYAWFIGASAGTANAYFAGISSINQFTFTSQPTTGQLANYAGSSTDYSFNPLAFDGLIPQSIAAGCYYKSVGGTLTADGANGVVEIDAALKYLWDTYRVGHGMRIYCGSAQARDILKKIMTGSGNAAMRINLQNNLSSLGEITGSAAATAYVNKYSWNGADVIPIEVHPNMPDGNIFIDIEQNPYPTSNIPQARAVRTRRDYFQVIWPLVTRQWPNGIYADEMLQMYVPNLSCVLQNIVSG